ncbi:Bor family protein [Gemmatimonadota bacterium]
MRRALFFLTLVLFLPACYHATVTTGLRPSTVKIEDRWADGWIYGLVPPDAVETMEGCPAGVAQVDTQLSFPNQLVNFLTFGIYTPMEIVVTCADDGEEDLPEPTTEAEAKALLKSGEAFLMRLH